MGIAKAIRDYHVDNEAYYLYTHFTVKVYQTDDEFKKAGRKSD